MSGMYNSALQKFLDGDLDWSANNIKGVLVNASYTYSAAHDALDDVAGGARLGTSSNFASKTSTAGVADAADITINNVPSGTVEGLVIYMDSGTEATSYLI